MSARETEPLDRFLRPGWSAQHVARDGRYSRHALGGGHEELGTTFQAPPVLADRASQIMDFLEPLAY